MEYAHFFYVEEEGLIQRVDSSKVLSIIQIKYDDTRICYLYM